MLKSHRSHVATLFGPHPSSSAHGFVGCLRLIMWLVVWLPATQLVAIDNRPQPQSNAGGMTTRDEPAIEIDRLIQGLSHPSFDVRSRATLQLCNYPLEARIPLQRAARSDDAERALRARAVLSLLDQMAFSGVDIKLSFSKDIIAWDQSVDLVLTLHNRSNYPATIPFQLSKENRATLDSHARQVGDMLDLSEWLILRGEDGRAVEFHLDDVMDEKVIARTIQERIDLDPKSTLGAGETVSLNIESFNRGWARYALLKQGRYTATIEYLPPWQDEQFIRASVGAVKSNTATISVARSAPPRVSPFGSPATLGLNLGEKTLTAVLTNRSDLPWMVNTNFGAYTPPSAQGTWVLTVGDQSISIPAVPQSAQDPRPVEPEKLVKVPPAGTIDLFSIDVQRLRDHLKAAAGSDTAVWSVRATYQNIRERRPRRPAHPAANNENPPRQVKPAESPRRRVLFTHLVSPERSSADLAQGHPSRNSKGPIDTNPVTPREEPRQ